MLNKATASELIKQGAVLVGSQTLVETVMESSDIDVACTWEQYIEVLESTHYLNRELSNSCVHKHRKNDYEKNSNTLWNGVETIEFTDGSKLDILFYYEEILPSIRQAVHMMSAEPSLFLSNKELRVRTYETLVKTIHTLKNQ